MTYPLYPTYSDPYTLPGTQITGLTGQNDAYGVRVHAQSRTQQVTTELYYYRDSAWTLFNPGPIMSRGNEPKLSQQLKQPYTLDVTLPDHSGLLSPQNHESPLNYNAASQFDRLIDSARKVLFRVGLRCFEDKVHNTSPVTPSCSMSPASGTLATIADTCDGFYGTVADVTHLFQLQPTTTVPIDITLSIGATYIVKHCAIRFASQVGTFTLPTSVQVSTSMDNVNWTDFLPRPVGGAGGDWQEDFDGRIVEVALTDIDRLANFVRLRIIPIANARLAIDEIGCWCTREDQPHVGVQPYIGKNMFVGYLGDDFSITPEGMVHIRATDQFKKMADNTSIDLTPLYQNEELGDIAYSLLTTSTLWKSQSAYNSPFSSGEIGWTFGSNLTGLIYPAYQGQTNSMYGYWSELFHSVGYITYADGNGTLQAFEAPYRQATPFRVLIAGYDGNGDARHCNREFSDKNLRNRWKISASLPKNAGGAPIVVYEPNSVARYGERTAKIEDPLLNTPDLKLKIGQSAIRDYAYRLQELDCEIKPDFDTRLKDVHAFRAPARPALFAAPSSVSGHRREGELWALQSIEHSFQTGAWWGSAHYIPYVPQSLDPPVLTSLTSATVSGIPTLTAHFDTDLDFGTGRVFTLNGYISNTNDSSGFTLQVQIFDPAERLLNHIDFVSDALGGALVVGHQYWVYLTVIDTLGRESIPSQVFSTTQGGSGGVAGPMTVTDFTVGVIDKQGPDAQGYYTYTFASSWTSPGNFPPYQGGMCYVYISASPLALPSGDTTNTKSWPWHDGSWQWHKGARIKSGYEWDNSTVGLLDMTLKFRTLTNFATGDKVYWRIWNSTRSLEWHPVAGNFCFCTFP